MCSTFKKHNIFGNGVKYFLSKSEINIVNCLICFISIQTEIKKQQ